MEKLEALQNPSCAALSHTPYDNPARPLTTNDTYYGLDATHYLPTKDGQHNHTGLKSTPFKPDESADVAHNDQTSKKLNNPSIIYK